VFNGADPGKRLETVFNAQKSFEDDKAFGKNLVTGFIEPYKKSWSEGKYLEVAGRALFDVGSMFVGGGEANAVAKGSKIAAEAEKAAGIANVASKAGKVTEVVNVVSKADKAAEVASVTGKTTEVAAKTGKVTEITSDASKVTKGSATLAEPKSLTAKTSSKTAESTAAKRVAIQKSLAKGKGVGDGLTREQILDGLTGLTKQGDRIAEGIRSGDIKLNLLSDDLFDKAFTLKGGEGASPQAFALGNKIYARRGSGNLLSDIVHEGTHAYDEIHGLVTADYGINPYTWEKRAFFHERQFQLAGGGTVEFEKLDKMLNFINECY
jgi:hypothetical protein